MLEKWNPKSIASMAWVLILLACASPRARAVDFLRGDANLDGVVSLADGYWIMVARAREGNSRDCQSAADANDTGKVDIADGIWIINYLFRNGPEIQAPSGAVGPDPTPDDLTCESSAVVGPLEDPEAELKVVEARVVDGPVPTARIVIALRGSLEIAGFSGALGIPPGLFAQGSVRFNKNIESYDAEEVFAPSQRIADGKFRFAYLLSANSYHPFNTAEAVAKLGDVSVVELEGCLTPGLAAGDYPLSFDDGELVDAASGRRIPCRLTDGVLHVESAVPETATCGSQELPPDPRKVDVAFQLGSVTAAPGSPAAVPFSIRSNAGVQGYSFSIDFDEEVLTATSIEPTWKAPSGKEYGFSIFEIDNRNAQPGGEGVDEGFLVGAAVFDFVFPVSMPKDEDVPALLFQFDVHPDATAAAAIRFQDGARGTGTAVVNSVTAFGEVYLPEELHSFVFLDGILHILPDVTLFVRGDSNGDGAVDISDALTTLGFLFLGDGSPACYDAADANDDGHLAISDPIFLLAGLFLGGSHPPAPFPDAGEDPTPDSMGCLYRER